MPQKDFEKIFEISKSLNRIIRDTSAADSILVSKGWRLSCGEIIFSRTRIADIKDEELIVEVEGDRWFHELSRIKGDLIIRLNEFLGIQRFKRIVLRKRNGL